MKVVMIKEEEVVLIYEKEGLINNETSRLGK